MSTKSRLCKTLLSLGACLFSLGALAQQPIKVGVLHSLSGTMAISETTLKDTVLMLVEEQNAKGGVLGRPLQAVVVDPASENVFMPGPLLVPGNPLPANFPRREP